MIVLTEEIPDFWPIFYNLQSVLRKQKTLNISIAADGKISKKKNYFLKIITWSSIELGNRNHHLIGFWVGVWDMFSRRFAESSIFRCWLLVQEKRRVNKFQWDDGLKTRKHTIIQYLILLIMTRINGQMSCNKTKMVS